jgi:hypothetical protein
MVRSGTPSKAGGADPRSDKWNLPRTIGQEVFSAAASFGICNSEDDDIGIDIGTQLGRDLRDVLLLIVSPDPRQHGDCKGESDHNPVAG